MNKLNMMNIRTEVRIMEVASFIYGLKDPRTNKVRYVGQSVRPEVRFKTHMGQLMLSPKSPKNIWLRELNKLGLQPTLEVLEIAPLSDAGYREMVWIDKFKGPDLVNFHTHGILGKSSRQNYTDLFEKPIITLEKAAEFYRAETTFFKKVYSKIGLLFFIENDPNQLFVSTLQIERYNTAIKAGLFEMRDL